MNTKFQQNGACCVGIASALLTTFVPPAGETFAGEETTLRILRPKTQETQTAPTWTEIYYIVIDARHPGGIEKLQLFKEGAKKAERSFSEKDRHESGYFLYKRRMKSPSTRDYVIHMWPAGSDPETDEPIVSERSFPLRYANPDPAFPDYLGFVNLSDGEIISANDPDNESDFTTIFVDCQDSSGTWGQGQWKEHLHMGYRDDDGIDWVELVIASPDGKKEIIRNEKALILDSDQEMHGCYWGEAEDNSLKKSPEEPWSEGTAWQPIEGFGLYEFKTSLPTGKYDLSIRAKNNAGAITQGPTISIIAQSR